MNDKVSKLWEILGKYGNESTFGGVVMFLTLIATVIAIITAVFQCISVIKNIISPPKEIINIEKIVINLDSVFFEKIPGSNPIQFRMHDTDELNNPIQLDSTDFYSTKKKDDKTENGSAENI